MNVAAAAEIKVISSPPLRSVLRELAPRFESQTGYKLAIRIAAVADLKCQIDAGTAFDVAILTPPLIDSLIDDGTIAVDVRANIARAGLGIVVRTGGRKPGVGSVNAVKCALLDAKSVMYASGSAVMAHIERMFEQLGIAEDMRSKSKLLPAGGYIGQAVAGGATELGLTMIPVILETNGVDFAGPLPAELQFYVDLSCGVSAGSKQLEGAKALIQFLMSAEATEVIEAKGLERCLS
jgi:molybdate transport system substrate-binding protein